VLAAGQAGLQSPATDLIQTPTAQNGPLAIVKATAIFADGRLFSDYGDASPRNTSAAISAAVLRMAATRAKGRVLRDALGVGEPLAEEIPDDHHGAPPQAGAGPAHNGEERPHRDGPANFCGACGIALTHSQHMLSEKKFGRPLCPACQRQHTEES